METIPLDPKQANSYEALLAFLQACQFKAKEKGEPQLVSIAAAANALDPLAVLESIYESDQLHFYVEKRRDGIAIAGAEKALEFNPSGAGRFSESKQWIAETLANTIAVGDARLPFFGPSFFCGYSFFDQSEEGAVFPNSIVFVPRWQVAVKGHQCVAIANAVVEPDSEVEPVAMRIWNANTKFRSFDYGTEDCEEDRSHLKVISREESGGPERFRRSVSAAVERIKAGEFRKIVLARALDLEADQAFHPLEILNTLRDRYEDCYAFSLANGLGQSFIGASPERLVSVSQGRANVDVLAGTAPRGLSASEDARLGAALLASAKDRHEHRIVFDSVCRRLRELGLQPESNEAPSLKKLENVQHLFVDVSAKLPEKTHLLDLVERLHPTPAVGGNPREKAVPQIRELEGFDRGLYAGAIGWVSAEGEGEFLVGIRSALVEQSKARLYAGVGVVEGSDPEREHRETDLKFQALLENLL